MWSLTSLPRERRCGSAADTGASLVLFPELGVTGYTCADLFYQTLLLESARAAALCAGTRDAGNEHCRGGRVALATRGQTL